MMRRATLLCAWIAVAVASCSGQPRPPSSEGTSAGGAAPLDATAASPFGPLPPAAAPAPEPATTIGVNAVPPPSPVRQLTAGDTFTCALLEGGTVRCWGENREGQLGNGSRKSAYRPTPVTKLEGATQIAAGEEHACALLTGGTVRCWGDNEYGQLGDGTERDRRRPVTVRGLSDVAQVAAAEDHTCARSTDGSVRCWGLNGSGQVGPGAPWGTSKTRTTPTSEGPMAVPERATTPATVTGVPGVADLVLGPALSCAILSSGAVRCWGDMPMNASARSFGHDPNVQGPRPRPMRGVPKASGLALESYGFCAVVSGAVHCAQWDTGRYDTTFRRFAPLASLSGVKQITPGNDGNCALRTSGTVHCWKLQDGPPSPTAPDAKSGWVPGPPKRLAGLSSVVQLVQSSGHSCALGSNGNVRCWGGNWEGQLGDGSFPRRLKPTPVVGLTSVAELALGGRHSCARLTDGTVRCWGHNRYHQIDGRQGEYRFAPTPVPGLAQVSQIGAGSNHTCARLRDGSARCWGENDYGQLGSGSDDEQRRPVAVAGLRSVSEVAAAYQHSCARLDDGTVRCWGRNENGQLGDGTHRDRMKPTAVADLRDAVDLSVWGIDTCAARAKATVRCWGFRPKLPVKAAVQVAVGSEHRCALGRDGRLWCYGANDKGQLGQGDLVAHSQLVEVQVSGRVRQVATGTNHTCALVGDAVYCFGENDEGQVGDGTRRARSKPVAVLRGAAEIAAGPSHTCARMRDGTVRCWGTNEDGELADGSARIRPDPTPVAW